MKAFVLAADNHELQPGQMLKEINTRLLNLLEKSITS